jgi:hypothetical protein
MRRIPINYEFYMADKGGMSASVSANFNDNPVLS